MRTRLNVALAAVVVACALSFWWARRPADPERRAPVVERPAPEPLDLTDDGADSEQVRLVVLNGTGRAGLAREFSVLASRLGCVAVGVANAAHEGHTETLLVNRRLSDRRAAALARSLGGVPVIREFDARCDEEAVLVLGADADDVRPRIEEAVARRLAAEPK